MIKIDDKINNKMGDKIMIKNSDNVVDNVYSTLRNSDGLTITELVNKTKLNRSAVRIALAKLEGARKVNVRKIGMAKVYLINGRRRI